MSKTRSSKPRAASARTGRPRATQAPRRGWALSSIVIVLVVALLSGGLVVYLLSALKTEPQPSGVRATPNQIAKQVPQEDRGVKIGGGNHRNHVSAAASGCSSIADGSQTFTLTAQSLSFDTNRIALGACSPTTIKLVNGDAVAHNFSIWDSSNYKRHYFNGRNVLPGSTMAYSLKTPASGRYYFQCDIHSNMNGTLVLK